jgi:hypothetical protein
MIFQAKSTFKKYLKLEIEVVPNIHLIIVYLSLFDPTFVMFYFFNELINCHFLFSSILEKMLNH